MLLLPREGFRLSVNAHNVELDALVEWIEGSITFVDEKVTQSDVVDILTEEEIYRSQAFAMESVEAAWAELSRRQKILGTFCPYAVNGPRVQRIVEWTVIPAYSFCLFLALQVRYRKELERAVTPDYPGQGVLFERLTLSALKTKGLGVHSTAWSKADAASIRDRVEALADHLGERARDEAIGIWAAPQIKDGGLDVVCHLPFADGWGGRPLYLVQCASGDDWKGKKATPKVALWDKLIDFTTRPLRGIAIPFVLLEDEFRREANDDLLALLLDRHRLAVSPREGPNVWPEADLRTDLNAWTQPRVEALPRADG